MKISYLITCSNETDTLYNLLDRLYTHLQSEDELIVVYDTDLINPDGKGYVTNITNKIPNGAITNTKVIGHGLNNNYSEHKNWGARQCSKSWIMQIDGDELPTETLLINLKDIIEANPGIEAFWIPRINDFKGVTQDHAKKWGWKLTESPTYKRPIVNFPDFQCRLFLNIPDRIKWVGRLHERIEGNINFVYMPADEDLALYHDKTIEKQIETNVRYNKLFTEKENKGFTLPG